MRRVFGASAAARPATTGSATADSTRTGAGSGAGGSGNGATGSTIAAAVSYSLGADVADTGVRWTGCGSTGGSADGYVGVSCAGSWVMPLTETLSTASWTASVTSETSSADVNSACVSWKVAVSSLE